MKNKKQQKTWILTLCVMLGAKKSLTPKMFSLTSFCYHMKSKHEFFSDVTEQKCLRFSQMSFLDGTTNFQRKGLSFHCSTVGNT